MNTAVTSLPLRPAAARLRPWLARVGAYVWHSLETAGRARAERHLLYFAEQCQDQQPELAKELRAAVRQSASA